MLYIYIYTDSKLLNDNVCLLVKSKSITKLVKPHLWEVTIFSCLYCILGDVVSEYHIWVVVVHHMYSLLLQICHINPRLTLTSKPLPWKLDWQYMQKYIVAKEIIYTDLKLTKQLLLHVLFRSFCFQITNDLITMHFSLPTGNECNSIKRIQSVLSVPVFFDPAGPVFSLFGP